MNWSAQDFLPNRISSQMAILIVISLIVLHLVIAAGLFWYHGSSHQPGSRVRPAGPIELVTVIRTIAVVPQDVRPQVLAGITSRIPGLDIRLSPHAYADSEYSDPILEKLKRDLGPDFRIASIAPAQTAEGRNASFSVRLPNGEHLVAQLDESRLPRFGGPLLLTLLFIVISVTVLAVWAARFLAVPLNGFVRAAEGFTPDENVVPIPERGPFEIRTAARALNQMRERIKKLVQDRTRMLAAMGHDLRTPITRMRLRCEFLQDSMVRDQMMRDLDQMKSMIDAVLSYLRDGSREAMTPVDIATLAQTICDEFSDEGHSASYDGPAHLTIDGRPDDLQRAIRNLVDNAIRYAGNAKVCLSVMQSMVRIEVEDRGPGIADAEKAAMLEPFVRGDAARSMNDSYGFGLGLTIARGVAEAHHGKLTLHDGEFSGLIVRIDLPRKA